MKKIFLFFALQIYSTAVFAIEDDECIHEMNRKVFQQIPPSSTQTLVSLQEKTMEWDKHLHYTFGAFGGAVVGSFFVNIFDTIAARKFALTQDTSWKATTRSIFSSYVPVLGGVVPMRALSFGVYSLCQELLEDHFSFGFNKVFSAALSGISLTVLTIPAEISKTRRQIDSKTKGFVIKDLTGSFVPLASRIVPTVTCMLAGTEAIQMILPIKDHLFISTLIASLIASSVSQVIGTPAENIRTYRVKERDYQTSTKNLIKTIQLKRLYAGFWHRAFALGAQATFTLVAAKLSS